MLSDNMALSGYNISLCVVNFVGAVIMFFLGCVSFWVIGKSTNQGLSLQAIHAQS